MPACACIKALAPSECDRVEGRRDHSASHLRLAWSLLAASAGWRHTCQNHHFIFASAIERLRSDERSGDYSMTAMRETIGHSSDDALGADLAKLTAAWSRVCQRLRAEFGEDVYSSWFARLELDRVERGVAFCSVPTKFLKLAPVPLQRQDRSRYLVGDPRGSKRFD